MIELKPCPFCGSEAKLVGDYYPNVVCQGCYATTGDVGEKTPESTAKAIAAWNRRAKEGQE